MVDALKLQYDVHDPNGNVLLPAGSVLTQELLADLIQSAGHESFIRQNVTDHGGLAADIETFCAIPPYDQIFADSRRSRALFSFLKAVELPEPLLRIIDFFKAHDPYTYRHVLIVFALSVLLLQDGYEESPDMNAMAQACTTHDMGKFCVPVAVLKKASPLGRLERNFLEHHSGAGYVLLSYYFKDHRHPAAITARDHHERCNGSGYPKGLHLENRIVEIVAVCDVFDALISPRPYRPTAYDLRTALEEITDMAEKGAIPWDIAKALIRYNRKDRPSLDQCIISRTRRGTPPKDNLYQGVVAAGGVRTSKTTSSSYRKKAY